MSQARLEGKVGLFVVVGPNDLRKKIGTLLETPNFYHYLSAERNLKISAKIKVGARRALRRHHE